MRSKPVMTRRSNIERETLMSDESQLKAENLVQVYKSADEVEATVIEAYLRENGVADTCVRGLGDPLLRDMDLLHVNEIGFGVYVLEHDGERARALVAEFQSANVDGAALEAAATAPPPVEMETQESRDESLERQRTWKLFIWVLVIFAIATALMLVARR